MSGGADAADGVARVEAALRAHGIASRIERFPAGTATVAEAAAAVGCEPGQIVKTLVFLAEGRPAVALAAGDRRIDDAALARLLGVPRKRLKLAPPTEVLARTGYAVGGVPPLGLPDGWDVVADESLARFGRVWAAAGAATPCSPWTRTRCWRPAAPKARPSPRPDARRRAPV